MVASNIFTDSLPYTHCGYNPPLIVRFSIDAPCFFWLPLIRIKQRLRQNDLPLVLSEGRFWKFLLIPARFFRMKANIEIDLRLIVLREAMPAVVTELCRKACGIAT
ncbi:hypothetical protein, partial [Nostoc sp. UHCC 0251]|uniref:hypothetical protein n=1 Tax=Nostoc sp. UHCC 0251 TaxID=3110240 RepID=UPI002B1F391E